MRRLFPASQTRGALPQVPPVPKVLEKSTVADRTFEQPKDSLRAESAAAKSTAVPESADAV